MTWLRLRGADGVADIIETVIRIDLLDYPLFKHQPLDCNSTWPSRVAKPGVSLFALPLGFNKRSLKMNMLVPVRHDSRETTWYLIFINHLPARFRCLLARPYSGRGQIDDALLAQNVSAMPSSRTTPFCKILAAGRLGLHRTRGR